MLMIIMISMLIVTMSILLAVAFFTLLERKFLSYSQLRKGPNKVSLIGIMQPIADAMKLLTKSQQNMESMNFNWSFITPVISLTISLSMFPIIPLSLFSSIDLSFNTIIFMIMSSMMVYIIMSIGWSCNSKYSHLGAIRTVAQMISYEISFFLLLMNMMMFSHSFNLMLMKPHQSMMWFMVGMALMFTLWLVICAAETNRSPFDFAEGESELVSGFNVEFSGGHFALIFLAEYASIIMMSTITTIMFSPNMLITPMYCTMFLWMRTTLPRFRYDLLMNLNWKVMLPIITILVIVMFTAASM